MKGGIDSLKELNDYDPESELASFEKSIEKEFRKNPPLSSKEASKGLLK
jgi:hypothetical protein